MMAVGGGNGDHESGGGQWADSASDGGRLMFSQRAAETVPPWGPEQPADRPHD